MVFAKDTIKKIKNKPQTGKNIDKSCILYKMCTWNTQRSLPTQHYIEKIF